MNIKNKFCFCADLRLGCLIYAWLQILPVAIVISKVSFISHVIKEEFHHFGELIIAGQFDLLVGIQLIKILASFPLIWGIIKAQHMYYQPWLFINGLENSLIIIALLFFFVMGCIITIEIIIHLCIPLVILSVYSWYIWSRVYIVYKRDRKPNILQFEENAYSIA